MPSHIYIYISSDVGPMSSDMLQSKQPTSGGALLVVLIDCCSNCVGAPTPSNWGLIYSFWASRPCGSAGWLALFLIKAGDVQINPGLTTHKQVWICDICHKQIHDRKQISIRCNRIEHWVHLKSTYHV